MCDQNYELWMEDELLILSKLPLPHVLVQEKYPCVLHAVVHFSDWSEEFVVQGGLLFG